MGGGDTAEVGHVLDGPHGEAAVDEAVVHEHVRHPEQRDPQPLQTHTGTSGIAVELGGDQFVAGGGRPACAR